MSWYDGDGDGLKRLYKLSLASGLFLAAPLVVGTLWYAWSSYTTVERYRRAVDDKGSVGLELFQVALHDELVRDLRALTLGERPVVGRLPTYELSLSPADVDLLTAQLGAKGAKTYAKGLLRVDGGVHEVEVRYRGEQPWHSLGVQKSMKIKVDRGDLVDGMRVFNLLNDPTPFGLEDQIILDLARDSGLLTPDYRPVRVRINNHDMGVYRLESQPDESLIRQNHRIPGNMYAGDAEKLRGDQAFGPLFTSTAGWTKLADRSEARAAEVAELVRFVDAVHHASHAEFVRFAERSLDLPRYARFDALDVTFGGDEHDFLSNHRFYADPYRGKLEPVAWTFRGFQRDETLNGVDSPLLVRLKFTPRYLAERDRAVYQLLTGQASVPAIHDRAERAIAGLAEELAADPYWDAYKLLPRASRLHRALTRPMSFDRWILATEYEIDGFGQRSRYLLDVLEAPSVDVQAAPAGGMVGGTVGGAVRLDVTVRGHGAYAVEELRAVGPCSGALSAWADTSLDGRLDPAHDTPLGTGEVGQSLRPSRDSALTTRARLVPREDASAKRGYVRVEQEPTVYSYFLEARECAPAEVVVVLRSMVTGASARIAVVPSSTTAPALHTPLTPVDAPLSMQVGELSPHPWQYAPAPLPRTLVLGPGVVELPRSVRYEATDTVEIAAGTTLALGPEASLEFLGKVDARGTPERPIVIRRLDPSRAFGGLSLSGPGTAGSALTEVRIHGGSHPRGGDVEYTALINVHDTRDITLTSWRIFDVSATEDVVHGYLVDGLVLHEVELERAPTDGIDLEFVRAELRGVRIIGAGDDGLDLMGSTLRLQDSLIAGAVNNGISAGEETDVTATSVVVTDTKIGVLAKNASTVRLVRSLVNRSKVALRARRKETRYGGPSRIGAAETFVVDAETVQDADKGSTIEVGQLRVELPAEGELGHVLSQVLHAPSWAQADEVLDALRERGGR